MTSIVAQVAVMQKYLTNLQKLLTNYLQDGDIKSGIERYIEEVDSKSIRETCKELLWLTALSFSEAGFERLLTEELNYSYKPSLPYRQWLKHVTQELATAANINQLLVRTQINIEYVTLIVEEGVTEIIKFLLKKLNFKITPTQIIILLVLLYFLYRAIQIGRLFEHFKW